MIAKLEMTLSIAQQKRIKHKTSQNKGSNNKQLISKKRTSALERTAAKAIGMGVIKLILTGQIFALNSAVAKTHNLFSLRGSNETKKIALKLTESQR